MGDASGGSSAGGEGSADSARDQRNFGPRNIDGTWMGGVVRGPKKPFPFSIGYSQGELTILDLKIAQ